MNYEHLEFDIVRWIRNYCYMNSIKSLVVGVSGGIDSAVTSTLCAKTGFPTYAVGMPIHQDSDQESLSDIHLDWLKLNYENVKVLKADLTSTFDEFVVKVENHLGMQYNSPHAEANTRSRLRMITLYQVATTTKGIVAGTGNKVEDYGVGFYTKYGDGGVDIAPIADLYKTTVWNLGDYMGVDSRIVDAEPTDGLWDDGRTDESQLGASYEQLEEAMEHGTGPAVAVLEKFNTQNKHKMEPIPTFTMEKDYVIS